MTPLVSLDDAVKHLKIVNLIGDEALDAQNKLFQAQEIVLGHIEVIDTGWTTQTVPLQIKAGILLVLAYLWEHRGEEDQGDPLSPAARSVLKMFRTPVFA